jgi:hypothetical protein
MLPPAIRRALAVEPARVTGTLQDIEHVVILMQENRSFDHYFGTLSGVRGFGDPRPLQLPSGRPVWYQPTAPDALDYVLPFHLDSASTCAQTMHDLNHDWKGSHELWKNHDAWVTQKTPNTMGYFTREDIPFHHALADAFTICDGYHASIFGPTSPNRMFLFSGTSGLSVGDSGKQAVENIDDGNWTAPMSRDKADFKVHLDQLRRAPAAGRSQLEGLPGVRQLRRQHDAVLRRLPRPPARLAAVPARPCVGKGIHPGQRQGLARRASGGAVRRRHRARHAAAGLVDRAAIHHERASARLSRLRRVDDRAPARGAGIATGGVVENRVPALL